MALLDVKALTAGYRRPLLENISFSLEKGEILGIFGRNGCGKTTLLRAISGNLRPFSGEVQISGRDCLKMSCRERAREMALLPQQLQMLEGISVRELLSMGRYPHGSIFASPPEEDKLRSAAGVFGVEDLLDADCARLSQGQRQLALLAGMLVQDTRILLLDEPDSALDYDNAFSMFRSLRELVTTEEKGALMVLHDPERALMWCDRLLLLQAGQLAETLDVRHASAHTAQEALRMLYPHISVWKDPESGEFHCNTER